MESEGSTLRVEDLLAESGWLRSLARQLVGESEADDLAQETLLAALRRSPRAGVPLRAWLAGISRKIALSRRRGTAHRAQREERVAEERARHSGPTPPELLEQVEAQRELAQALLELKEPYRHTVIQRYFEGISCAEIARRSGVPDGTVRWRLARGLALMRAELDERHEGRRALWSSPLSAWLADGQGAPSLALGSGSLTLLAGLAAFVALWTALLATGKGDTTEQAAVVQTESTSGVGAQAAAKASPISGRSAGESGSLDSGRVLFQIRAVDKNGAALPRATLRALGRSATADEKLAGVELALDADALDREELLELELAAPGYVASRIVARWRGEARVPLGDHELARAVALEGRVLEADGTPAAGATVLVEAMPGRYELGRPAALRLNEWSYLGSMLPANAPRTRADSGGRYRFDALPEGYKRIWARKARSIAAYTEPVALTGARRHEAPNLRLIAPQENEWLTGRVVDPRGAPVPGATIRAWRASRPTLGREGDESAYHTRSDARGHFELVVNPKPKIELRAGDPSGVLFESEAVEVHGGAREVVIELRESTTTEEGATPASRRATRWTGRVMHRGEPVADARVALVAQLDNGRSWAMNGDPLGTRPLACKISSSGVLAQTRTDEAGVFELLHAPRDEPGIRVIAQGFAPALRTVEPDAGPLEIELTEGARLAGRIVDAQGKGVAGVVVGVTTGEGVLRAARSNERGEYTLAGLRAGGAHIRRLARDISAEEERNVLVTDRLGPTHMHREPVDWDLMLVEGETLSHVLELGDTGGPRLRGRLLLDGSPPGPWRVELLHQRRLGSSTRASTDLDPQGRFDLRVPEPGEYHLRIWNPTPRGPWVYWIDRLRIEEGEQLWELALETGELLPAPGEWLEVAKGKLDLIWHGPGALTAEARVTREQLAREPSLRWPAGTLELRQLKSDPQPAPPRYVELAPGERLELELGPER